MLPGPSGREQVQTQGVQWARGGQGWPGEGEAFAELNLPDLALLLTLT